MKITVNEKSYGVVELYDAIAKQLGKDPEKCSYDCRKINVARNIQDGFFEYYKEQDDGRTKESALMSQIAMLLLNYGPKVDETLNNNEVELFDGFISETKDLTT